MNAIVFVGATHSGKSCILHRFIRGSFEDVAKTIVIEYLTCTSNTNSNTTLKLSIWDTSGQICFRPIVYCYIRYAKIGVIVFDLNDYDSFRLCDY